MAPKSARSNIGIENRRDIHAYEPALRRYFLRRVPVSDVDDLIQEVFVSMASRIDDDRIENVAGYIFTVAANTLKRSAKRQPAQACELTELNEPVEHITPERTLLARREFENITRVILELPQRTREIFVAHRFEEMSYAAIAKAQGISVSAVEKHIMQALRILWLEIGRD